MVRNVVRDIFFLGQKSTSAEKKDLRIAIDLKDTLAANKDRCVGMAANMIGEKKLIIIVSLGFEDLIMINPVLLSKDGPYTAEEGCLSLDGIRKTTRYNNIEVEYVDEDWKKHKEKYSGFTSQIIQHEMDHLEGILI